MWKLILKTLGWLLLLMLPVLLTVGLAYHGTQRFLAGETLFSQNPIGRN